MQFVICWIKNRSIKGSKKIDKNDSMKYNLAASFQNTINKILYKKTKVAIETFKDKTKKKMYN